MWSFTFKRARAIGSIELAGRPFGSTGLKVLTSICSERSSVRPGATRTLDDKLLGEAPLLSRVP